MIIPVWSSDLKPLVNWDRFCPIAFFNQQTVYHAFTWTWSNHLLVLISDTSIVFCRAKFNILSTSQDIWYACINTINKNMQKSAEQVSSQSTKDWWSDDQIGMINPFLNLILSYGIQKYRLLLCRLLRMFSSLYVRYRQIYSLKIFRLLMFLYDVFLNTTL